MRCLLIGNYGVGNLGDDLLKEYFVKRFPDVQWAIVSAHPSQGELSRLPGGVRSLLRFRWVRTIRAIRSCDAVVFGGGSLFTDSESAYACFLWWAHATVARWLRKPLLFAFQGIGPFRTRMGEWFAKRALYDAAFLSVRDAVSAERAGKLVLNTEIIQSFDPIFLLISEENHTIDTNNLFNRSDDSGIVASGHLVIIPRKNSSMESLRRLADDLMHGESFSGVVVASFQPDDPSEHAICRTIADLYQAQVVEIRTLYQLIEVVAAGRMILSERYHGSLAALALGKELVTIKQAEGDKHDALSEARTLSKEDLLQRVKRGEEGLREALENLVP